MTSISQNNRYLPHELNAKYYAVKLYRTGTSVHFVCRRYKISKSSLIRWNKKFDGTKQSLIDKSHKPIKKHPNAHSDEEIKWINDYIRRNPNISRQPIKMHAPEKRIPNIFLFIFKESYHTDFNLVVIDFF